LTLGCGFRCGLFTDGAGEPSFGFDGHQVSV
jgi:hypothetical protein